MKTFRSFARPYRAAIRFVTTTLSYLGHTLLGTTALLCLAVAIGYFPFTEVLGAGWDGWFVGVKATRLSLVATAARALVLPLLAAAVATATVEAMLEGVGTTWRTQRICLFLMAVGATWVATGLVPGTGLVTPDVRLVTMVMALVFARERSSASELVR